MSTPFKERQAIATAKSNPGERQYAVKSVEQGKASWYSIATNRGTKTASGRKLCNPSLTFQISAFAWTYPGRRCTSESNGVWMK